MLNNKETKQPRGIWPQMAQISPKKPERELPQKNAKNTKLNEKKMTEIFRLLL
jgi:hypothetical protein